MDEAIREQRRRVELRVAASCVGPLMETVLCKDVSEVDAEEFQRAAIVVAKLCWMDREVRPKEPDFITHGLTLARAGRFRPRPFATSGPLPSGQPRAMP